MKKLKWQKTNQKEVFDFIVYYRKVVDTSLGIKDDYPKASIIAKHFNISPQRACQYLTAFKKNRKK